MREILLAAIANGKLVPLHSLATTASCVINNYASGLGPRSPCHLDRAAPGGLIRRAVAEYPTAEWVLAQ